MDALNPSHTPSWLDYDQYSLPYAHGYSPLSYSVPAFRNSCTQQIWSAWCLIQWQCISTCFLPADISRVDLNRIPKAKIRNTKFNHKCAVAIPNDDHYHLPVWQTAARGDEYNMARAIRQSQDSHLPVIFFLISNSVDEENAFSAARKFYTRRRNVVLRHRLMVHRRRTGVRHGANTRIRPARCIPEYGSKRTSSAAAATLYN